METRENKRYMFVVELNGKRIYVSKPKTLREIDEHTVKYNNSNEILDIIKKKYGWKFDNKDANVSIVFKPNLKAKTDKKIQRIVYKKDKLILNEKAVNARFEAYSILPDFVLGYVDKYDTVSNFQRDINFIRANINALHIYFPAFEALTNKTIDSYRGYREMYFYLKRYIEKRDALETKQTPVKSSVRISRDNPLPSLSEEEQKRYTLEYLAKNNPELLDIDEMEAYSDISPFDGNRGKIKIK